MTVLYNDDVCVVCLKPAGVLSEDKGDACVPALLRQTLGKPVWPVHRLDRAVGGVMVYSVNEAWTGRLSQALSDSGEKTYLAVAAGETAESGTFRDLLYHDPRVNKTFVVQRQRKGVREAALDYVTCGRAQTDGETLSLVRVRLHTGRTHQIRVQFASRGMPLAGDRRYGSRIASPVALWSCAVSFIHPKTGQTVRFSHPAPDVFPFTLFALPEENI